jgi:hypothetical protein
MRYLIAAAALALGACAHTDPAIEIREVPVPVPQPCLTKEQLAALPEPATVGHRLGRTPETAEQDRDILAVSALELRAWGKTLFAAHKACAE